MSLAIQRINVGRERRIHLSFDLVLPEGFPAGEAEAALDLKSLNAEDKPKNGLAAIRGKYKGQCWMADDFDAPLEDFAEYM